MVRLELSPQPTGRSVIFNHIYGILCSGVLSFPADLTKYDVPGSWNFSFGSIDELKRS
jgi:hypothetical protein